MYVLLHQGVPICQNCCRFSSYLLPNMGRNFYLLQLSSGRTVVLIARFHTLSSYTDLPPPRLFFFIIKDESCSLLWNSPCEFQLQLIELLSIRAPSPEKKLNLLKEIAVEHELEWDPAASETEFSKKHEDLLVSIRQ